MFHYHHTNGIYCILSDTESVFTLNTDITLGLMDQDSIDKVQFEMDVF